MEVVRSVACSGRRLKHNITEHASTIDDDELDVEARTTVDAVKTMSMDRGGLDTEVQRLIFAGRQLEDGRTLAEYGIVPGLKIFLQERLCGGKPIPLRAVGQLMFLSNCIWCHSGSSAASIWSSTSFLQNMLRERG